MNETDPHSVKRIDRERRIHEREEYRDKIIASSIVFRIVASCINSVQEMKKVLPEKEADVLRQINPFTIPDTAPITEKEQMKRRKAFIDQFTNPEIGDPFGHVLGLSLQEVTQLREDLTPEWITILYNYVSHLSDMQFKLIHRRYMSIIDEWNSQIVSDGFDPLPPIRPKHISYNPSTT